MQFPDNVPNVLNKLVYYIHVYNIMGTTSLHTRIVEAHLYEPTSSCVCHTQVTCVCRDDEGDVSVTH